MNLDMMRVSHGLLGSESGGELSETKTTADSSWRRHLSVLPKLRTSWLDTCLALEACEIETAISIMANRAVRLHVEFWADALPGVLFLETRQMSNKETIA